MTLARSIFWAATLAIFAAVIWFYYWTAGSPRVFGGQQTDYYNLLVDGFQDGQLAMKVAVETMPPDGSPKPFLLDASFYRGKYHLYFGVTPALLLFWPWAAVTGHDLPEGMAAALLAATAYLLSLGLLRILQRHFFPGTCRVHWLAAVVLLGVATGYPVVLRHPLFYEVAIFSGLACSLGSLLCLSLAVLRRGQEVRWLLAASLGAGLAAGSRPTLIPGALLAVGLTAWLLAWRDRREQGNLRTGRMTQLALAAVLPAGLCGLGLAWYNWARFGSPLDFGLLHQQGSNPGGFSFTFSALWKHLGLYYFTPPSCSWYFPFFAPGANPPGINREQVHGQFFSLPLLLFAGAVGIRALARKPAPPRELLTVVGVAAVWAGTALLVEGMAQSHSNRYQLNFHPVFLLLVLLALLACAGKPRWRWAGYAALLWSGFVVCFNVCTSFHVHGFFQRADPFHYAKLARIINRDLVWPLHRLTGPEPGGIELAVRFPPGQPGKFEPLVVTGGGPDMDALSIRYTTAGRGQLVFDHLDFGGVESAEFDLLPGRARWLKVELGSLHPPAGHPWYKSQPAGLARARHRVAVTIDGTTVLDRDMIFYQSSSNQLTLGRRGAYLKGEERFSGEIQWVRARGGDQAWLQALTKVQGTLRLRVQLPRDRFGAEEPLVLTGTQGRADLVSVVYVKDGVVQFSVWHEGWPAAYRSAPVEWDYAQPMDLLIDLGSLAAPEPNASSRVKGVRVELDDRVVLRRDFAAYPADPTQHYVGCLPWPVTGCRDIFGGDVLAVSWGKQAVAPVLRATRDLLAGRPVELELVLPTERPAAGLPLLTTGITGRGDGLFIEYLSEGVVRFGFDHWGSQPLMSVPVQVEPGKPHLLTLSLGARVSDRLTVPGRLQVRLDGRPVFDVPVDLFPAEPDRVFFGANPIGMSTSQPKFTGELEFPDTADRIPPH